MDSRHLTPFERSLIGSPIGSGPGHESPEQDDLTRLMEAEAYCRRLTETLAVRKQIDGFLGGAGRLDEIGALLLTIITTGHLFAYNRAIMLLTDPDDGHIRGQAGIGTLSREEAWELWAGILDEGPDLERLVSRAIENFRMHNQRIAPLLETLDIPPGQEDPAANGFRGNTAVVLTRPSVPDGSEWLFDILGTVEVGVIPMWGYHGHFGALVVDNFASGRHVNTEGIQVLKGFVKPFVSALEKALIIDRYEKKVVQLQEASARIEAQHEMLLRMERKNTVGRFAATLAHNLLNPVVSMSGHLGKLQEAGSNGRALRQLAEALYQDLRDLEKFLGDFISQVQEEFPLRHYWDLNHLIGEVISSYRRFHNIITPNIIFNEGDIPLVRVDYERITDSLSRLMGIADLLMGGLDGLTISTALEGSSVLLRLRTKGDLQVLSAEAAGRIREEIRYLKEYLAEDEVKLNHEGDGFTVEYRI